MRTLVTSLWHETRGSFQRLPVWLPGTRMDLGDVGVFDEAGWVKQTTLRKLGITATSEPTGVPVDYNYSSHDGAQVSSRLGASADAAASGIAAGNVGLHVRFSRQGAFVLRAERVTVRRIGNLADVDRQILAKHQQGGWQPGWVVVSEVARAAALVMLVSGSSAGEAFVDLGVGPGAAGAPLASIGAGLRVGTTRGLAASFAGPGPVEVLWRGRLVRDRWWMAAAELRDRGPGEPAAPAGEPRPDDAGAAVLELEHPEDLPSLDEVSAASFPWPRTPVEPDAETTS